MWRRSSGVPTRGGICNDPPCTDKEAEAGMDEGARQCRICLSTEDASLGPLVSPCDCRGTMAVVHLKCLRTWRTSAPNWRTVERCPVCLAQYRDNLVGSNSWVLRTALRCPVVVVAGTGAVLLRAFAPWLHQHLAGALWMFVVAPLKRPELFWRAWELRPGLLVASIRWLVSGFLALLVPAFADHLSSSLSRGRSVQARLSEVLLLWQLTWRFRTLSRAAWVRSFEGTELGRAAKECSYVFHVRLFKLLTKVEKWNPEVFTRAVRRRLAAPDVVGTDSNPFAPILNELVRSRIEIEASALLSDSDRLVFWCHVLLWYCSDRGQGGIVAAAAATRAAILAGLVVGAASPALTDNGISESQAQAVVLKASTLLLSVLRGARVVKNWAVVFMV